MSHLPYVILPDQLKTVAAKRLVQKAAEIAPVCKTLADRFSRFQDLLPEERSYSCERRAISSIKLCDLREPGIDRLLQDSLRNLALMQSCSSNHPCNLDGCATCSPERRARETAQVAAYLDTVIRERENATGDECLLFLVTVTNRALWAKPLADARPILTGRRNSLRRAIEQMCDVKVTRQPENRNALPWGEITDIVASIDYYYASPPGCNEKTSHKNIHDRLQASLDIHLHSLFVFRPFRQTSDFRNGVDEFDFAKPLKKCMEAQFFRHPFKVDVRQISPGFTAKTVQHFSEGESQRFDETLEAIVEVLSYLGKSTTCDISSAQERPMIQAVFAQALRSAKSITKGKPFILRSSFIDKWHSRIVEGEADFYWRIKEAEEAAGPV